MRPISPVRALVTTSVSMMIIFGGASAPALSGVAAEAGPTGATTHSQSTTPQTQVLAHRKHHKHQHHKHKHHKRKHVRKHHGAGIPRTTRRWTGAVNTYNLGAVNAAYQASFASGLDVPTNFSGDESRCIAGSTSSASRAATLRAINFVRSMAGLAPVTFSADLNARSQSTALMMSANRAVSHSPSRSWRCYSAAGAANAGRANLALAYPELTSAGLVRLYTTDPGAENRPVGHRRWLLNPFATTMGSGSTRNANAITVIGPSSSSRANPSWVAWPTAGYFPDTLEPDGRWSISAGSKAVSFASAQVRVYRNGVRVQATKNPVVNGYAQPTLSWQVPASVAKSGTFKVLVSNIKVGKKRYSTSYSVAMFTPRG
jgi:uncharacterized protein YkwD